MFGLAVVSEKAAVSCELCESCCAERTVANLKFVWLSNCETVTLVEFDSNTPKTV